MSERCYYCEGPATLLCDGALGKIKMEESPEEWDVIDTGRDDWLVTCDRPLCRRHAKKVGVEFWHGSDGCGFDTVDLCQECTDPITSPLVTEEAALALRRRREMTAI